MKNKANRRMKEKTNTLSMLCVFPSRCCGGRSFVCVCCLFSVSSGSNWWISDDYSNVGGLQKDKLWRKKRKGNCVVWRRSVTARPLSVFVFFCSFFLPFFQSFGGGSAGGPPRRENIRRFIPRSVQSVCVVFSKRKRYLKINSSSVRSVFVCPRR